MRRCAISIPNNMAESYGRNSIQVGAKAQREIKTGCLGYRLLVAHNFLLQLNCLQAIHLNRTNA